MAYQLDCAQLLVRCEAIMVLWLEGAAADQVAWLTEETLSSLQYADQCKLPRLKQTCLTIMAAVDKSFLECDEYTKLKSKWSNRVLVSELLEARISREGKGEGSETRAPSNRSAEA